MSNNTTRLMEEDKRIIERPFSNQEIKEAIFSMGATKTPGPDDFPVGFHQKYWNIVGADVTKFVLNILEGEESLIDINHTYLVLIPKQEVPEEPSYYRPTNICNVAYKIVAKVLVNKLK